MIALAGALTYLGGSVPIGLLIGRWVKGVDVRTRGSGNIGTTNVLRVAGPFWAAVTFILDAAKGFVPVMVGRALDLSASYIAVLALLAVAGHNWSVFLRFQGGKGVATSIGALLGLWPTAAAAAVGVWVLTVGLTGYASLGSLLGLAASGPVLYFSGAPWPYAVLGLVLLLIALWKHRANVQRLVQGKELAILPRRRPSRPAP